MSNPTSSSSTDPALSAKPWVPMPYGDFSRLDADTVLRNWSRLQAGQCLEPPEPGPLVAGWVLYHNGEFERAAAIGLDHGNAGLALANRATAIYANYLEPSESVRLALFKAVVDRTAAQMAEEPDNCQALYWHAYALGRYGQGISVARAHAQGLGEQIKRALERVITLQPQHADAHFALGTLHAEVIDKVGTLVARMTYGARAETAIEYFEHALALQPDSLTGLMEYARALPMLHGESSEARARSMMERVASSPAADARERLDIELARIALTD